ncbi:MAG: hypothetical protein KF744_09055 [Taibaiella sp.]|nr:hypothetical protein [Taibaiella sp.]
MAYEISDFNGGTDPASVAYPFGDVTDVPGGTLVDRKSLDDIWQFFQKVMNLAGVTPNNLPDNATNGYQLLRALEVFMNAYAQVIFRSLSGYDYDATKKYVVSGAQDAYTPGWIWYNGEIYYYDNITGPACGPGLVPVVNIIDDNVTTETGLRVMRAVCGASGSGDFDFSTVTYFNAWVDMTTPTVSLSGGGTVTVGTWNYKRYLLRGRTVTMQLRMSTVTITGSGGGTLDITLDFLGTKTAVNNNAVLPCATANDGTGWGFAVGQLINGTPTKLKMTYGTWADNTYTINVDVTFEISG